MDTFAGRLRVTCRDKTRCLYCLVWVSLSLYKTNLTFKTRAVDRTWRPAVVHTHAPARSWNRSAFRQVHACASWSSQNPLNLAWGQKRVFLTEWTRASWFDAGQNMSVLSVVLFRTTLFPIANTKKVVFSPCPRARWLCFWSTQFNVPFQSFFVLDSTFVRRIRFDQNENIVSFSPERYTHWNMYWLTQEHPDLPSLVCKDFRMETFSEVSSHAPWCCWGWSHHCILLPSVRFPIPDHISVS